MSRNHHFGSSLKLTVLGQNGRFMRVKLNGPNHHKWTFIYQNGRFKRLKVDGQRKWKSKSGQSEKTRRPKGIKLNGLKGWELSKRLKMDYPKHLKWTVQKSELSNFIFAIPFRTFHLKKFQFLVYFKLPCPTTCIQQGWFSKITENVFFSNFEVFLKFQTTVRRFNLVHFCLKSQTENSRYPKYKWPEFVFQLNFVKHVRTS